MTTSLVLYTTPASTVERAASGAGRAIIAALRVTDGAAVDERRMRTATNSATPTTTSALTAATATTRTFTELLLPAAVEGPLATSLAAAPTFACMPVTRPGVAVGVGVADDVGVGVDDGDAVPV